MSGCSVAGMAVGSSHPVDVGAGVSSPSERRPAPPLRVVPSSVGVSARMSRHPRRDTGPELALRRLLHAAGYRFRIQYPVPGMPRRTIDIAFTKRLVAVFVDGCFWHGCRLHRTVPNSNAAWWRDKLSKNVARDGETDRHLREQGWRVVRVWEHERAVDAIARIRDQIVAS